MNPHNFPSNIGIAIPAYKAESELRQFLPQLLKHVPAKQITVFLDGVFDSSHEVCEQFGVTVIFEKENRGKGAALKSLFAHLTDKYEWIISMDADGQHLPEEIVGFVKAIQQATSRDAIVLGSRLRARSRMPRLRQFSNGSTSKFLSLTTGTTIEDSQCGYRAYRLSSLQEITCKYNRFEMESEILIRIVKAGFSIQNIPISTCYNGETSHISHVPDTLRWIRAVLTTLFSTSKGK